ncbi:MAG: ferrous iron transport protein A [Chloroflexi bacterium]|nr:MAG: ferrous iron transport protein A [Chloroflexota bacterium]
MRETKPLSELKPGQRGKVVKVGGKGVMHRRILDMGIVPGVEIKVERVAPLGDPVDFKVLGYHLSLRREEAENVYIEVL